MLIILSICLIGAAAALLVYAFLWRKGFKERALSAFEQLSATMQIENAQIQRLPALALSGTYRTFDLTIECSRKKVDGKRMESWYFTTHLMRPVACKFFIQGESNEGRLRKVIGLDVLSTGDDYFDNQILVFSSCREDALKVFGPYMRQRFLWAGLNDFSMEISGEEAAFSLNLEPLTNVRYVRHALEVWTEFLNVAMTL